jgi:hypothetical protein
VSYVRFQNTIAARPSSLGQRSPSRPALGGTFLTEPPLHLAAGSHWLDLDEETEVRCQCDFGCDACTPEETKPR